MLKRFFILPYLTGLFLLSVYSLYQMFNHAQHLAWLGSSLALLPLLIYMANLALRKRGRGQGRLPIHLVIALLGLAVTLVSGLGSAIACALYGTIGLVLYDYWYTPVKRDRSLLTEGAILPEFTVLNHDGQEESSHTWLGQPNLIMFIRGNWCPLCVAQVGEIAAQYQAIHAKGVIVRVISAQPEKQTRQLANKFDVPMQFYSDPEASAAATLNSKHVNGVPAGMLGYQADTVLPTVLITKADGVICYADLTDNYRDRPEPQLLMDKINSI